ncbi:Protein of uncharacterised function (DUF3164) [Serratia liquefaciens]|nr:Protein of uncharacterised function (DUF3164) [Serratia liquefaciens]
MTTEIAKNNGVPEGYMKDRKGRLVPIEQVSPFDIEMDAFVRAQVKEAEEESQRIKAFKNKSFDNCYAYLDLVAGEIRSSARRPERQTSRSPRSTVANKSALPCRTR